jgi:hypothetical protein
MTVSLEFGNGRLFPQELSTSARTSLEEASSSGNLLWNKLGEEASSSGNLLWDKLGEEEQQW